MADFRSSGSVVKREYVPKFNFGMWILRDYPLKVTFICFVIAKSMTVKVRVTNPSIRISDFSKGGRSGSESSDKVAGKHG